MVMYMDRNQKIYRASVAGILLNLALVGAKTAVGVLAGSVAVLTDAINNLTDTLSAAVTLVGTKWAQKKPDHKHPHGHGRIEYVTATIVGLIILAVGIGAVTESVPLILEPKLAQYSLGSLIVIVTAIVAKLAFGGYLKTVGKETRSRSLAATGTDALFDAALSFGTLVGAGVSLMFGVSVDGWIGVVIAAFIIRSAVEIITEGMEDIIGKRVDEKLARKIRERILEFPGVMGVKQLTLHDYGPTEMIGAVKIEVREGMRLWEFRELAGEIERELKEEFEIKLIVGIV